MQSEDDHEPAPSPARGHAALRVRCPLGRKGLRHAKGEPPFADQMTQSIERFMVLHWRFFSGSGFATAPSLAPVETLKVVA